MENSLGRCRTRGATITYQNQNDDKFQTERKIADEIMAKILELQLPFKLDQPTEGLGNCFPIAIVQQLQRPEILKQLRSSVQRLTKHRSTTECTSIHNEVKTSQSCRIQTTV